MVSRIMGYGLGFQGLGFMGLVPGVSSICFTYVVMNDLHPGHPAGERRGLIFVY